jgi:hypothetical protein
MTHPMKIPVFLLLVLLTCSSTYAQYWMQQAITERVALWLRVQDGNWDPASCAFDAEEVKTGVFKMSCTPIELPGCKATEVHRAVVNPRELVNLQQETRLLTCSHTDYHQVTLAVAVHTPQVKIRFDPLHRDRFAIYALGCDAHCIKSWDDAAEE